MPQEAAKGMAQSTLRPLARPQGKRIRFTLPELLVSVIAFAVLCAMFPPSDTIESRFGFVALLKWHARFLVALAPTALYEVVRRSDAPSQVLGRWSLLLAAAAAGLRLFLSPAWSDRCDEGEVAFEHNPVGAQIWSFGYDIAVVALGMAILTLIRDWRTRRWWSLAPFLLILPLFLWAFASPID